MREVFISKKRWIALEKRVVDLEYKQSQPIKIDEQVMLKAFEETKKKIGKSMLNY